MSSSNTNLPPPEAPKGTLPYGASPVHDHPQVPPGCIPTNTAANLDSTTFTPAQYNPATYPPPSTNFPPPPQRDPQLDYSLDDDPSDPAHYMRNPSKLIAYLVSFPAPHINVPNSNVPQRFMIYTPPPPPLHALDPNSPAKEAKMHKVQRKWQAEVRAAKTSTAKTASWKGVKSKATRGINWAMNQTTSSNIEFLGRMSPGNSDSEPEQTGDGTTKKTVPVDEMVLVYPSTMNMDPTQMRTEFVNTMLRTKSKAQRDAVLATGLMPVAFAVDIMLTLVWPFGGLVEIDGLWAWASFRGAKTARSVTKRLSSASAPTPSSPLNPHDNDNNNNNNNNNNNTTNDTQLRLTFVDSRRTEMLRRYLAASCHQVDADVFPTYHTSPTETQVLEAIGWSPAHTGGATRNWEDEAWETAEVKDDIKLTFHKAAREWRKYCLLLEKNPEKAARK